MKSIIQYQIGDIFNIQEGIIVHGVNCSRAMNSGIAKAIREKWPKVYESYLSNSSGFYSKKDSLGTIDVVKVGEYLFVINAYTQLNYGREATERYVSYDAIDSCFKKIADHFFIFKQNYNIYFPLIGAGLGNGHWPVIAEIINYRLNNYATNNGNVICVVRSQTDLDAAIGY